MPKVKLEDKKSDELEVKPKSICMECKEETNELFEKVTPKGTILLCRKCRPMDYNRFD